jgi:hypothetical protein
MKKDVELKSPSYEGGDLGEVGNIVKASNPLLISPHKGEKPNILFH